MRVLWYRMWLSLIVYLRQGYIVAQNQKKCYPEWVVFFIYRNMSNLNTSNEVPENPETKKLSNESQLRVNATVDAALKVLELSPETGNAIGKMFDQMIAENLREPAQIQEIQDGLFDKHKEYIANLPEDKKQAAEVSFTSFIEKFSQNLAYMHRDINWSNELNTIKSTFENKRASIQASYEQVIKGTHPV